MAESDSDRTEQVHGEPGEPGPVTPGRDDVPDNLRAVSFHTAVRGYDRREVDRYVERVNRVIAELEITRSPESAVRHALDRVGEQTSGILQHARQTADEITHTARSEAEETTARGKAEANDIVSQARAKADRIVADAEATLARAESDASDVVSAAERRAEQVVSAADTEAAQHRSREEERLAELRRHAENEIRELRAHIDTIRDERGRLFGEIHELAARLERLVDPSVAGDAAAAPEPPATELDSPS